MERLGLVICLSWWRTPEVEGDDGDAAETKPCVLWRSHGNRVMAIRRKPRPNDGQSVGIPETRHEESCVASMTPSC